MCAAHSGTSQIRAQRHGPRGASQHNRIAHNFNDVFSAQGVEVAAVTGNRLNWVKKTFGDLAYEKIKLEGNGRLKITSPLGQLEVAVVYYR